MINKNKKRINKINLNNPLNRKNPKYQKNLLLQNCKYVIKINRISLKNPLNKKKNPKCQKNNLLKFNVFVMSQVFHLIRKYLNKNNHRSIKIQLLLKLMNKKRCGKDKKIIIIKINYKKIQINKKILK